MRRYEIISGSLLALGAAFLIAFVVPGETTSGDGFALPPSLIPNVSLAVICTLSVLLVLSRLFGNAGNDEAPPMDPGNWLAVVFFCLILGAGFLGLKYLGFLAGGAFLVLLVSLYIGERRMALVAGTTVAAPAILYFLFWKLLVIQLP